MAGKFENIAEVPCGNTVCLVGVDQYLLKQGTIASDDSAHNIRAMKFSVSPVVRVAVQVQNVGDLPKLVDGLKKLSKSDPLVVCTTEASGEHVVAGCGELHVEICLKDLEEQYAQCPIKKGQPVVPYKETVTQESQACLSKSPNNHNRLWCKGEPLGNECALAIEEEKFGPRTDPKDRGKLLVNEYRWEKDDTSKIWCFGPDATGPNMCVDVSKGVQFLNEIKDSVDAAF